MGATEFTVSQRKALAKYFLPQHHELLLEFLAAFGRAGLAAKGRRQETPAHFLQHLIFEILEWRALI